MRTRAYTDGGCKLGAGGWAVFIEEPDGRKRSFSGHEADTTNNRMELMAVIQALLRLWPLSPVSITCDSQYVLFGIQEYVRRWKLNGWINSSNEPVRNRDLWERLDALVAGRDIEWRWTKGHKNNRGNVEADRLAGAARKAARKAAEGS